MLLKEFLPKYPDSSFDLMTPGGFVKLTPEQAKGLLAGEPVRSHPGIPEASIELDAEELLLEPVEEFRWENGVCHMLTGYPETAEQEEKE